MSAGTIDSRRLQRAIHLECEPLGWGSWLVRGGAQPHVVEDDACDCWDANAGRVCKHRLRVLLQGLAPEILAALRVLVPPPSPPGATSSLTPAPEEG